MFASVGLVPLSMAVAGALIQVNAPWLLVGSGMLLVATVALSMSNPALRSMALAPVSLDDAAREP